MNFDLFSGAVIAMMLLVIVVMFYETYVLFKAGNKPGALFCACIAVIIGLGTYAVYGDKIIQWFK